MPSRAIILLVALGLILVLPSQPALAATAELSDISVMFAVADGFGWNYFDLRDQLEEWNVNVTTVSCGLSYEVDSCYNKEPRPIVADLVITDVSMDTLGSDFDAVVVPAGGHWAPLISTNMVLQMIASAYDQGSVVGAVCIGNRVLARALNLSETFIDGTKVASYAGSNVYMENAGAEIVYGVRVVSDNRVVTGGSGGGPTGGGNDEAPAYQTCLEIVRAAAGESHLSGFELQAAADAYTVFSVTVNTTQLHDPLSTTANVSEVEDVEVLAYLIGSNTPAVSVELSETGQEGVFYGGFELPEYGIYSFSVEIQDSMDCYVVVRNVDTLDITGGTGPFPVGMIAAVIAVFALGAWAVLALRRR